MCCGKLRFIFSRVKRHLMRNLYLTFFQNSFILWLNCFDPVELLWIPNHHSQSSNSQHLYSLYPSTSTCKPSAPCSLSYFWSVCHLFFNLPLSIFWLQQWTFLDIKQCLYRDRLVTQLCLHIWLGGMPVLLASPKWCHYGPASLPPEICHVLFTFGNT